MAEKHEGFSTNKYMELKYFCRQYDAKRRQAADILLQVRSVRLDRQAGGHTGIRKSDVEYAVLYRDRLLSDVALIDSCAHDVCGGEWFRVLIENVCRGVPPEKMSFILPSYNHNAFYTARKQFFDLLDERRSLGWKKAPADES